MKIQEQQAMTVSQGTLQARDGSFAGRAVHVIPMTRVQQPLSVLLRGSITLDRVQEVALQRLQQGEHLPLSTRRIRVV